MMTYIHNIPLKYKFLMLVAFATVGALFIGAFSSQTLKENLLQDRFLEIKKLVEVATDVVEIYHAREKQGLLSKHEAQRRAMETLRKMRAGESQYYFIVDRDHRLVMPPENPELEGQDQRGNRDPNGKRLFVEMVDTVREQGAGRIAYEWPKPGAEKPQPKVSYVKGFTPWGWIIGTGIYIDDVDASYWKQLFHMTWIGALVLALVSIPSFLISKSLLSRFQDVLSLTHRLAAGDLSKELHMPGRDELGEMARSLNETVVGMRRSLEEMQRVAEQDRSKSRELQKAHQSLRQRADALHESERRLATLMANLPGMAYRCRNDRDWTMEFVSDGVCDLTDYRPEDLVENRKVSYGDIMYPDDREHVWIQVQAALRDQKPFNIKYRIQTVSREIRWVWEQGRGIFTPDAELLALEGFITDITDAKRAEQALRESEEKYRRVVDNANEAIFVLQDGMFKFFNPKSMEILGYSKEALNRKPFTEFIHSDDRTRAVERYLKRLAGDDVPNVDTFRITDNVGHVKWVEMKPVVINWQNSPGTLNFLSDITERKQIELALSKLSSAVEQSGSSVVITDKNDVIEYVNPRFTEVNEYAVEEAIGQTPAMLRSQETSVSVYRELWETILSGHTWHGELRNRRKGGALYWSLMSISPIENERGEITHFVGVGEDVTVLKETQEEIVKLAFYDPLTGLENRRLFRDRLEQAIKGAHRSGKSVALLYLDLDQFKRVNDTLGHDAGDALLIKVADRLRACVRQEDTVARIGGDEFTLVLSEVEGTVGASTVARKILQVLGQPNKLSAQEVVVTTSIGITLAPDDGVDAEVLMKNADLAMYRAKEQGRNNYQFFTDEMNKEVSERLLLENELRGALMREEFVLYFQPMVSLDDQQVIGMEALLRWQHPLRGVILPNDFIRVAEETGLIVPLGEWVLRNACRQARALQKNGLLPGRVAINLSVRQFREPKLLDTIREALAETGLEPCWLELEITESMIMENLEEGIEILNRFKALGLSVSIDDFGTGYSSLSYLRRLPVDNLKVDSSFVQDIPRDINDVEITAAVIAMAHKLQLKVVAEGVESFEQLDFLRQNRCEYGQGYLFSRPLPPHELTPLLAKIPEKKGIPPPS